MATIVVNAFEKGLVLKNGELINILDKGNHFFNFFSEKKVTVVKMNSVFVSSIPHEVLRKNADFCKMTTEVNVGDNELALVFDRKKLKTVLKKGDYFLWNEAGFRVKMVDTTENQVNDIEILRLTSADGIQAETRQFIIGQHEVGLLHINGKFIGILESGAHVFWKNNITIEVQKMDLRIIPLEILGQEILTKDKIGLRLNFHLSYQIKDVMKVAGEFKELDRQIYTQAQLALRAYIGSLSLDEILEKRAEIGSFVQESLKNTFLSYGIDLIDSGIKDIILPGEVREIMNQVLIAEKKAQANVIMRREETASTRSLLNTAKLMEESAMLTKLKELEFIERISERFNELNISGNGNILEQFKTLIK